MTEENNNLNNIYQEKALYDSKYNSSKLSILFPKDLSNDKLVEAMTATEIECLKSGKAYLNDVIHSPKFDTSKPYLIPRVLHQTYKDRCVHPAIAHLSNNWIGTLGHKYDFMFFDDDAMNAMLYDEDRWKDTFPSLNAAIRCIDKVNNPTMKSDIWRYLQLWEYGGIYADIDTR